MDLSVTLVALVYLFHLVIGIAHTLLGRQAEGVHLENLGTFLDTTLKITLFK